MKAKDWPRTLRGVLAVVASILSLTIMAYLWKVWGDRGMYADSTGTSGYTTKGEGALLVLCVVFAVLAIVMLIIQNKQKKK